MDGEVAQWIVTIREQRVLLAADLAALYGVETRVLNQAVKRNADRFPADFAFQLTPAEFAEIATRGVASRTGRAALRSQTVILKQGQHSKYPPYAFTEHGAIMAATVLNSAQAVGMSIFVVRAFVQLRDRLAANAAILRRLAEIDSALLEHDHGLRMLWSKLQPLLQPPDEEPQRRIGFHAHAAGGHPSH